MKFGVVVRNMGPQSEPQIFRECALTAEACGFDELWVTDHLAIPPDDAEGSGGRYLDPLTGLAWLAGCTERIGLGTGILNLPYRPALPTAKAIATVQELSGGRLRLGVGVGWMQPEFRALGVERRQRGRLSDAALAQWQDWFAADEVAANGQAFLFKPRPPRPPIFVGGGGEHALARAVRYGDGWMPMGSDPEKLRPQASRLQELARQAGRAPLEIVAMGGFPLDDARRSQDHWQALAEIGVTRLAMGFRYDDASQFRRAAERVAELRRDA
jgi:probable F420-dependent oxidoreductase